MTGLDYEIWEVSCGAQVPSFESQMSSALKWQEQFGYDPWTGNLDALNDGMRYYPFGPSGRSALVLAGFHRAMTRASPPAPKGLRQFLDPDQQRAWLDREYDPPDAAVRTESIEHRLKYAPPRSAPSCRTDAHCAASGPST